MKHLTGITLACALLASGCSPSDERNEHNAGMPTDIIENIIVPDETNVGDAVEPAREDNAVQVESGAEVPAHAIPAALRGRWGMVRADCTSTHGDAKGLLEISATDLVFYESRGKLTVLKEREATRIVGGFAFSGEGMTWQRTMLLEVQDDGKSLIRRDYGTDAEPGPYHYSRC